MRSEKMGGGWELLKFSEIDEKKRKEAEGAFLLKDVAPGVWCKQVGETKDTIYRKEPDGDHITVWSKEVGDGKKYAHYKQIDTENSRRGSLGGELPVIIVPEPSPEDLGK